MFDISFGELAVIGAVALVVIGPEKLPKVARTLGHLVGRAQRYMNTVKADIQREVELQHLRELDETLQNAGQQLQQEINQSIQPITTALEQAASSANATAGGMPPPAEPAATSPPLTAHDARYDLASQAPTLHLEPGRRSDRR